MTNSWMIWPSPLQSHYLTGGDFREHSALASKPSCYVPQSWSCPDLVLAEVRLDYARLLGRYIRLRWFEARPGIVGTSRTLGCVTEVPLRRRRRDDGGPGSDRLDEGRRRGLVA